ncbi:MAG: hypothetical protein ACM3X9_11165 [Bacillota bacterium]
MAGRRNKPQQLQLELPLGYWRQLNTQGEELSSFETTTLAFLGDYPVPPKRGPIWDELNRAI